MPDRAPVFGKYLDKCLTDRGEAALGFLREKGCDIDTLGSLFIHLAANRPLKLSRGRVIHLRPLDTWETALGGISREELAEIAESACQLRRNIANLRKTALVQHLVREDVLPRGDALATLSSLPELNGLMKLPRLAKRCLDRQSLDYDRLLNAIYSHIHERTGQYFDEKVADVLNDMLGDPEKPKTQGSLKQWRYNHDPTGTR